MLSEVFNMTFDDSGKANDHLKLKSIDALQEYITPILAYNVREKGVDQSPIHYKFT